MSWAYREFPSFNETARKQFKKLGRQAQREILGYLDEWITSPESPRRFGKALKADLSGLWRNRVGDYRILCQIQDHQLVVLVVASSSWCRWEIGDKSIAEPLPSPQG